VFRQILAHAYNLCALSGEEKCGFAHSGRQLNMNLRNSESANCGTRTGFGFHAQGWQPSAKREATINA
jgi:hypothetical protein